MAKNPRETVFAALYQLLLSAPLPFQIFNTDGRSMRGWEQLDGYQQPCLFVQEGMMKAEVPSNSPSGYNLNRWTYTASVWVYFRRGGTVPLYSPFALTAAATASGGNTVYTGTIPGGIGGAPDYYVGYTFDVEGFVAHPVNNGKFKCVASTATTLTLANPAGVAETHAATATAATPHAITLVNQVIDAIDYTVTQPNLGAGLAQTLAAQAAGQKLVVNVRITDAAFDDGFGDPQGGQAIVRIGLEILTSS